MEPQNPNYLAQVRQIFKQAPFIAELGIELQDLGPGWCQTTLKVLPKHYQQDRFVHAGVQATMADHTAGAATAGLIKPSEIVLTVEFKINLLRPAMGQELSCRAKVLRPGRSLHVVESEVFARSGNQEKMTAKAMVTIAVVPAPDQAAKAA